MVDIPHVAGMSVAQATAALTAAQFRPVASATVSSSAPAGQVVGTQPAGQAVRTTTVVILTSAGSVPAIPTAAAATTGPTP